MAKHLSIIALLFFSIGINAQYTYELQPHYECGNFAAIDSNSEELLAGFSNYTNSPTKKGQFVASAWTYNGIPAIVRSYINFPDLKYLLPLTNGINNASLKLFMHKIALPNKWYQVGDYRPHQTRGYCNLVRFTRLTEPWGESISWENQPSLTEGDLFSDYVEGWENECDCPVPKCDAYEHIEVDLTEMAKWWQQNPEQIFGVQFRLVEEFVYNRKCFTSSNSEQFDEHPIFVLETDNEIRFFDPVYYITPDETIVISAPIENATYNWNGQSDNNDYFVVSQPGDYDVSITLPNCFTLRNEFQIRHKLSSPISFPISSTNLETELVQETFKPIKGKPSSGNGKTTTFTLFNANGTPIFTSEQVPKDIYDLKSKLNLNKGLYLYKTVEQDVRRNTIISKSGKFFNL